MSFLKFLVSIILVYASLVGWSCNTWLSLWMMVEIVFMTFMMLVVFDVNYAVTEMTMKYFLVQVMSGIFLLICVLLGFFGLGSYVHWLLWGGLAVKLGLVPFHFWAISVVGKIGWLSLFFMLSFIKLLPIAFLVYLSESFWAGALLVPSALVGSFCGINNQFIQKLLSYSGMVSTCWLALAAAEGFTFFFFFFVGYVFMLSFFSYLMHFYNIYYVIQFKFNSFGGLVNIYFFFWSFLFSGIPPFLGFLLKWGLSWSFLFLGDILFLLFLIVFSVFSLFYYIQLCFYLMLINSFLNKWYFCSFSLFFWSVGFFYILSCFLFFNFLV